MGVDVFHKSDYMDLNASVKMNGWEPYVKNV